MTTASLAAKAAWARCGVTDWIVGGHPVREGLYQVKLYKEGDWYWCYFSLGHTWGWMADTPEGALTLSRRPHMRRLHSFRGLASNPAATITGNKGEESLDTTPAPLAGYVDPTFTGA